MNLFSSDEFRRKICAQALGSLVMEDVDMAGNTLIPSSTDRTCWIHKLETRLQGSVGPVPGPQGTTGRESEEGPTGEARSSPMENATQLWREQREGWRKGLADTFWAYTVCHVNVTYVRRVL